MKNLTEVYVNKGKPCWHYDGYAGCPIFTGDKKLLLAEFGYDGVLMRTFPFQDTPNRAMYYLKRYYLPYVYWSKIPNGKWSRGHITKVEDKK